MCAGCGELMEPGQSLPYVGAGDAGEVYFWVVILGEDWRCWVSWRDEERGALLCTYAMRRARKSRWSGVRCDGRVSCAESLCRARGCVDEAVP